MFLNLSDIRKLCSGRIEMLAKQGYDITGLKEELEKLPDSYDALFGFGKKINHIPLRKDFPYMEPDDLEGIRQQRPAQRQDTLKGYINEMEIRDKVYGGVFGRMLGCSLGKPLEVDITPDQLRSYLEDVDAWPLTDFVPAHSPNQTIPLRRDTVESMRGFVEYVQEDDDINYIVLGLKVLEDHGVDFTTQDMAKLWRFNLPYYWTFGPERSRYLLIAGLSLFDWEKLPQGKDWDELEAFLNDGEELIGAMIRGDAFGLVNPGRMEKAAEMAWRDGRITHGKTGLYAEMWVAAVIAAAYFAKDPIEAIQAGNAQIPFNSRYAECLREALEMSLSDDDWYRVRGKIAEKWGHLGHAGTLNETAAIINALVHSWDKKHGMDFEKAICITVMHGWDTDCSGATAGCMAGVFSGYRNIPRKWLDQINDTYYSCVATERNRSISAFAERMYQMSRIVRSAMR